jgi:thioredoxin-related protein
MIKYLIEDLKLALNENIYTYEINKNKTEEIKENIEQDDKNKINVSDTAKNFSINSNEINPINVEKK